MALASQSVSDEAADDQSHLVPQFIGNALAIRLSKGY